MLGSRTPNRQCTARNRERLDGILRHQSSCLTVPFLWANGVIPTGSRGQMLPEPIQHRVEHDFVPVGIESVGGALDHDELARNTDLVECRVDLFTVPEWHEFILVPVDQQRWRVDLADLFER